MKKNSVNSLVLGALSLMVITPAGMMAISIPDGMRGQAVNLIEKAKALNPNPMYWADKTTEKAKRSWFCLRNKSQCSQSEVNQARAWFIGVPVAIATALLVAAGVKVIKNQVKQIQEEASAANETMQFPSHVVQILAGLIQRNIGNVENYERLSSAKRDNIRIMFEKFFPQYVENYADYYTENGDIKKQLFEQAIQSLKTTAATNPS